ncbi:MAG: carbohydrate-binding protein [Pseudochelatococcus sp.]|jgi:hypothetical protein|uniref:carbohydrate-binding protein n=1 Tax=Pseudochelatococcus sp. TaxID=2020869 RepID=UPI003D947E15
MQFTLKVVDATGAVRAARSGEEETFLVHRAEYAPGDVLTVEADGPRHIVLSLDGGMAPALVYLTGPFALPVPFGERKKTYPPNAFSGSLNRLTVRAAHPEEIAARRNLAFNPWDDHANATLFPHGSANVETRGEAVFAARNAIDGEIANDDHGFWPYTSWGINRDPEAALTIAFGRPVRVDEVAVRLRADFPHDAWWERAMLDFSDGSQEALNFVKTGATQRFRIAPRVIDSARLHSLIKADDPSPFPALTQIEFRGTEA